MTYDNLKFLPYNSCNINELNLINSKDRYFSQEEFHIQPDINNNEIKTNNLCDDDLEISLTNLIDCNYYSTEDFQEITRTYETSESCNRVHLGHLKKKILKKKKNILKYFIIMSMV